MTMPFFPRRKDRLVSASRTKAFALHAAEQAFGTFYVRHGMRFTDFTIDAHPFTDVPTDDRGTVVVAIVTGHVDGDFGDSHTARAEIYVRTFDDGRPPVIEYDTAHTLVVHDLKLRARWLHSDRVLVQKADNDPFNDPWRDSEELKALDEFGLPERTFAFLHSMGMRMLAHLLAWTEQGLRDAATVRKRAVTDEIDLVKQMLHERGFNFAKY